MTRIPIALALLALLSGCASTSGALTASEPEVRQSLSVKCRISNMVRSGCKTQHDIYIVMTLGRESDDPKFEDSF